MECVYSLIFVVFWTNLHLELCRSQIEQSFKFPFFWSWGHKFVLEDTGFFSTSIEIYRILATKLTFTFNLMNLYGAIQSATERWKRRRSLKTLLFCRTPSIWQQILIKFTNLLTHSNNSNFYFIHLQNSEDFKKQTHIYL